MFDILNYTLSIIPFNILVNKPSFQFFLLILYFSCSLFSLKLFYSLYCTFFSFYFKLNNCSKFQSFLCLQKHSKLISLRLTITGIESSLLYGTITSKLAIRPYLILIGSSRKSKAEVLIFRSLITILPQNSLSLILVLSRSSR